MAAGGIAGACRLCGRRPFRNLYEQGRFLGQDLDRAENLYERAAKPSGGTIYVYQPPVGKGAGQVVPVNMGPRVEGLAEAARRLERLKKRRKLCVECI